MSKSQYMPVPKTGKIEDWQDILDKMPEPEKELDGMAFKERVILLTNSPNKKNPVDNSNTNVARNGGTGNRDSSQIGSFSQGIIPKEKPPRTLWDEKTQQDHLWGGFGRSETFAELGYKYWVYDRYSYDSSTRNKFQKSDLDVLEDQAISDNGTPASKPPSKNDYLGILVRRIEENGWDKDDCMGWFDTVNHCLTKEQIRDYSTDAIKRHKALGRIEWFKENEVKQEISASAAETIILNTANGHKGNTQRFLRTLPSSMKAYIESQGSPQEYTFWNSNASSHEELDDSHSMIDRYMKDLPELMVDFVEIYRFKSKFDKSHRPFIPKNQINQKITGEASDYLGKVIEYDYIKNPA